MPGVTAPPPATPPSYRVSIRRFENLTGNPADDFVGRLVSGALRGSLKAGRRRPHAPTGGGDTHGLITVAGSYFLRDDVWRFQALVRTAHDGPILGAIGEVTALRGRPWEAADELRGVCAESSPRTSIRDSHHGRRGHPPPISTRNATPSPSICIARRVSPGDSPIVARGGSGRRIQHAAAMGDAGELQRRGV